MFCEISMPIGSSMAAVYIRNMKQIRKMQEHWARDVQEML
jgi:hypothetical protein